MRTFGALKPEPAPADKSQWASGILEFSTAAGDGATSVKRRLILRSLMSNPQKGVMLELYRPEVIDVNDRHLRVRGVEPTPMGSGPVSAMVQEWLIVIGYQVGPGGKAPLEA